MGKASPPNRAGLLESAVVTTFIFLRLNSQSDICVHVFNLQHTHNETELVKLIQKNAGQDKCCRVGPALLSRFMWKSCSPSRRDLG